MGAAIPVRATAEDKKRLAFKAFKLLEMPPTNMSAGFLWSLEGLHLVLTLIHN